MNNTFSRQVLSVKCCEESLLLHPEKVVYWPARKTLLAADIHIGKEHAFARAGIPIPGGISENTLNRLMQIVDSSAAERLIILGDLLHATPRKTESWQTHLSNLLRCRSGLTVQVIVGNHDSKTARDNVAASLDWHHSLTEPPFLFKHEPEADTKHYVIAGHIHPAYRLTTGRRSSVRSPAFWFREHYAVLPAFGEFTGGHLITREPTDRLYLTGCDSVVEV